MGIVTKLVNRTKEIRCEMLTQAMWERFGLRTETQFNIISMAYVTYCSDGKKLTKEQRSFCEGWFIGFHAALDKVEEGV